MVKRVINALISERLVISVIVINTVALFVMAYTDPELAAAITEESTTFKVAFWIDYACVVYFLIEVALKWHDEGNRRYWSSSWNRFDFIIVLLSAPVLLHPLIEGADQLSLLLVLRVGRLFRLFRVMRFIPNREHIYQGVKRALKASVGVLLALVLINLVLSLGATQLFGRHAPEHFGNPAISSYSMFRIFTVEGWHEIPAAIAKSEHATPFIVVFARLYFSGAVLIGGILGLSLANAVFVDEMTMDNNRGVEAKLDLLTDELRSLRQQLADTKTIAGD